MKTPLFIVSKDIPGGIPVQNLIDYLAGGATIDEFLDEFPTV